MLPSRSWRRRAGAGAGSPRAVSRWLKGGSSAAPRHAGRQLQPQQDHQAEPGRPPGPVTRCNGHHRVSPRRLGPPPSSGRSDRSGCRAAAPWPACLGSTPPAHSSVPAGVAPSGRRCAPPRSPRAPATAPASRPREAAPGSPQPVWTCQSARRKRQLAGRRVVAHHGHEDTGPGEDVRLGQIEAAVDVEGTHLVRQELGEGRG